MPRNGGTTAVLFDPFCSHRVGRIPATVGTLAAHLYRLIRFNFPTSSFPLYTRLQHMLRLSPGFRVNSSQPASLTSVTRCDEKNCPKAQKKSFANMTEAIQRPVNESTRPRGHLSRRRIQLEEKPSGPCIWPHLGARPARKPVRTQSMFTAAADKVADEDGVH